MNKLEKIEELINKVLFFIMEKLTLLAKKACPNFVIQFYRFIKRSFTRIINFLIHKVTNINLNDFLENKYLKHFVILKNKMASFPLQENINEFVEYMKTTPLEKHRVQLIRFKNYLFTTVSNRFHRITNQQFVVFIVLFMCLGLGGLSVFYSGKDIYKKENAIREPASVINMANRPKYRNFQRKTFKVFNIKIPVFVESVNAVKTITVDFSIRTSNRFTKKYLISYEYKMIDYFFTRVEPVVSSFPLEDEGKETLKEIITIEINNFLRSENVEGEIEEVNIIFIVAS